MQVQITLTADTVIQAGSSIRGSSDAPDRNSTQEVANAIRALVVHNRTTVAEGV